ncbi:MAG: prepilin-type N-terminal cleavage/methylation domain-containing protein [Blastocatellia bacterium]
MFSKFSSNSNSNRSNSKSGSNSKTFNSSNKGFSLLELVIVIILAGVLMAVTFNITIGGVKNGELAEDLSDVSVLVSSKTTKLFNNLPAEMTKFGTNQTLAGSIDPTNLVPGYFDVLNQSGCVIGGSVITNPSDDDKGDDGKDGNPRDDKGGVTKGITNKGGGLPLPTEKEPNEPTLNPTNSIDCSDNINGSNGSSINDNIPRFRRQWAIAKDKPSKGDVTVAVTLVDLRNLTLVRSEILTKVDGASAR